MAGITGLGQKIETAKRVGAQAGDFTQTTSSITGTYSGASGSTTMVNDFIGMDYTQVETIRTSIREYVNTIQSALDKLRTETNAEQGFKGEIKTAIENYVSGVVDCANAYTSQLLEFSDKMQEAYKAFVAHESGISSQVSSQASQVSSSSTNYTEQQ